MNKSKQNCEKPHGAQVISGVPDKIQFFIISFNPVILVLYIHHIYCHVHHTLVGFGSFKESHKTNLTQKFKETFFT